jgi:hypothetical protein
LPLRNNIDEKFTSSLLFVFPPENYYNKWFWQNRKMFGSAKEIQEAFWPQVYSVSLNKWLESIDSSHLFNET